MPAKQPWWIWINTSCVFIMRDCITTTKQSTTKLCAYFLGYTVSIRGAAAWLEWSGQTVYEIQWSVDIIQSIFSRILTAEYQKLTIEVGTVSISPRRFCVLSSFMCLCCPVCNIVCCYIQIKLDLERYILHYIKACSSDMMSWLNHINIRKYDSYSIIFQKAIDFLPCLYAEH